MSETDDNSAAPNWWFIGLTALAAIAVVSAVMWIRLGPGFGSDPSAERRLVVALINGPTSYYNDQYGPTGFEYDFVRAFARDRSLELEVRTARTIDEMLEWVRAGEVDMGVPGVVVTDADEQDFRLGPTYHNVDQIAVYSAGKSKPRKPADLVGKTIEIQINSGHSYTLERLKRDYPRLTWTESRSGGIERLLEAVNERSIDVTVVDSHVFQIYRRYFPRLRKGFVISSNNDVAWIFPKSDPRGLLDSAQAFVQTASESGLLATLNDRHYGHLPSYAQISTHYFLRHIDERLKTLEPAFRGAGLRVELDWRLLAAIAYQESHWDPAAVSPTGVRGLMMLTRRTAAELGIEDREDPDESIDGGARYIRGLINRMPDRVPEPDRVWMALAAYNIGMGHLEDSRRLTEANGADPDQWIDVARHLPLLSDETWHSKTRYGFAHGRVAVHYVEQIRSYYDILRWVDKRRKADEQPSTRVVSTAVGTPAVAGQ